MPPRNKHPHPPTLFGILRHGQTKWNTIQKIQGSKNSPLTDIGKTDTKKWAKQLASYKWDRIIASDLGRVRETVAILNKHLNLPVLYDKRLREQSWGEWEGLTLPQLKADHGKELRVREAEDWNFSAPGGETRTEVQKRTFAALQDAGEQWKGQRILIITHQGVLKVLLYSITGRKFSATKDPLADHDCFHLVEYSQKQFIPLTLNITNNCKV